MSRHARYIQALLLAVAVGGAGLALYTVQTGAAPGPVAPVTAGERANQSPPHALQVAQAAPSTTSLPGGASALNETYQDWLVSCATRDSAKRCALSQNQVQQNGQRVLAIELNSPVADVVEAILVLPFGLALEQGVTLSIDDQPLPLALRFRTCLPAGCIAPVSFDLSTLKALKAGAVLGVATVADGNQPQLFSISLKGFAAALDRLDGLTQ